MAGNHGGRRRTLKQLTRYDDIPALTEAGRTEDRWDDSLVLFKEALPLKVLDDNELAIKVQSFLVSLTKSVTEESVYEIILLAWNMRTEKDPKKRIFPSRMPQEVNGSINDLSKLPSAPEGPGHAVTIPTAEEDIAEFNRQGCFYAASLLKLFTKEHESWMRAQEHIAENYKKFTDVLFSYSQLPIWSSAIVAIRRLFQTKAIYRKTLGVLLYSLNKLDDGRRMTQMLFEQHLSFTGLHIIRLFCRACDGLRTEPKEVMRALHIKSFEPTLDQLFLVIKVYMGSTEQDRMRETYKFARIYNPQMFSLLQTKNCSDIVCILGHICVLCGNAGSGNVMDIAAISQMSEDAKTHYGKVARNIFTYFKATQ